MDKFPEFYLETNQKWGMITCIEELEHSFNLLLEHNYDLFSIYAKPTNEYIDGHSFGTYSEYNDYRNTLFQFLDKNGVDISKWLLSTSNSIIESNHFSRM